MDSGASNDTEMAEATVVNAPSNEVRSPFTFTFKLCGLGCEVPSIASAAQLLLLALSFTFEDLPT